MFLIRTKITYRNVKLMRAREFNARVLAPAWRDCGLYWRRVHWQKHFTEAGAAEYGYAPRKGSRRARGSKAFRRSYVGRKEKDVGHTDPLVYLGKTRAESRHAEIRATSKGVRVVMRVPWYIKRKPPNSEVDMQKELSTVSPAEEAELTRYMDDRIEHYLQSAGATYSRTV